jgi:hypothetical protein
MSEHCLTARLLDPPTPLADGQVNGYGLPSSVFPQLRLRQGLAEAQRA